MRSKTHILVKTKILFYERFVFDNNNNNLSVGRYTIKHNNYSQIV